MRESKRKRLEAAGWRVGDAADFLGLTPEEAAYINVKIALSDYLRETRVKQAMTQADVANSVGSSQSRVAKMEASDVSVSIDLIITSLLALGATPKDIGRVIAEAK